MSYDTMLEKIEKIMKDRYTAPEFHIGKEYIGDRYHYVCTECFFCETEDELKHKIDTFITNNQIVSEWVEKGYYSTWIDFDNNIRVQKTEYILSDIFNRYEIKIEEM